MTRRTDPDPVADYYVVRAMARDGGGFVRALAAAFDLADPENYARLKAAFPEYWNRYQADRAAHAR